MSNRQTITLLRLHLVERVRRYGRGTARAVVAAIIFSGWTGLMYLATVLAIVSNREVASEFGSFAAHAAMVVALIAGAVLAIEAVRPGGRWARLAFFPLRRAQVAAIVLGEGIVLTLLVAAVWMAPGMAALLQFGAIDVSSWLLISALTVLISVIVVAWTSLLGLMAARFLHGSWAQRHAQEMAATLIIIINWGVVLGLAQIRPLRWMAPALQHLPVATAQKLFDATLAEEPARALAIPELFAWALVPCVLLWLMPLREKSLTRERRGARARRVDIHNGVIARSPVSLPRETFRRFHAHFLREPGSTRGFILVTLATFGLVWLISAFAGYMPIAPGAANVPMFLKSIETVWAFSLIPMLMGLFALAAMLASLALPLERGNILFVRLSSLPPSRVVGWAQLVTTAYPLLVWALGLAFYVSRGAEHVAVWLAVTGPIVIAMGSGFGMLLGALFGRYDWKHVNGALDLPGRIALVAVFLVLSRVSVYASEWVRAPGSGAAIALRLGAILLACAVLAVVFTILSVRLFERRPPDELAVRTLVE